ncbi:hypothetical protein FSP39_024560 [Pinctada imbricata]|uniref:Uncharacterized protein n=1 Tax=Pinctada imbricata TaxID=66713 RepID=A0AA89BLE2_PINIB|nr:hypothetical protein FSP39_024560 [Pinctada imbricata]
MPEVATRARTQDEQGCGRSGRNCPSIDDVMTTPPWREISTGNQLIAHLGDNVGRHYHFFVSSHLPVYWRSRELG